MLDEEIRRPLFFLMFGLGMSSLVAYISSQIYVKVLASDLWEKFFPGRSVGFSYDLHFKKFVKWYKSSEGEAAKVRLPWFLWMWNYYWTANRIAIVVFAVFIFDFIGSVVEGGMIGGWQFR